MVREPTGTVREPAVVVREQSKVVREQSKVVRQAQLKRWALIALRLVLAIVPAAATAALTVYGMGRLAGGTQARADAAADRTSERLADLYRKHDSDMQQLRELVAALAESQRRQSESLQALSREVGELVGELRALRRGQSHD